MELGAIYGGSRGARTSHELTGWDFDHSPNSM